MIKALGGILALPEMPASRQVKDQATEAKAKAAKAQPEADALALIEAQAGGALCSAETEVPSAEASAEEARLVAEAEAAEAKAAEAKAAEDKAAKVKASGKASNLASITAASMLAQICERNFMEHQLAARHFKFFHFCEHMRPFSVCVCVCP